MDADPKSGSQAESCPVDHKSREAWLSQAQISSRKQVSPSHPTISGGDPGSDAESCPVDHGAREAWMQQSRRASGSTGTAIEQAQPTSTSSSWTSYIPRIPFFSSASPSSRQTFSHTSSSPPIRTTNSLGVDREVSTIPRATSSLPSAPSAAPTSSAQNSASSTSPPPPSPANQEQETGADAATGNWIYPSEKMFFEAMKRKGHAPQTADMRTIVPIHNAVNERAWAEIKKWEGPWVEGSSCSGPRLHSFSGLSTRMTPKARLMTLLGYQAPFDRHDWVVDRCGREIEYVIDFYAGRGNSSGNNDGGGGGAGGKLSFYLDVRPKLNTWEGVKMRALRVAGLA